MDPLELGAIPLILIRDGSYVMSDNVQIVTEVSRSLHFFLSVRAKSSVRDTTMQM